MAPYNSLQARGWHLYRLLLLKLLEGGFLQRGSASPVVVMRGQPGTIATDLPKPKKAKAKRYQGVADREDGASYTPDPLYA
jgi:hypothetical protein